MKRLFTLLFCLIYSVSFSQTDILTAQEAAQWIKSNKNLRIIDASKSKIYQAAHLKNAVNIPVSQLVNNDEIPGLLKTPAQLASIFGQYGISEKNDILVYDEGSQKYASRMYWVLKYLGVPNVKILHKNNQQWRKARLMQTSQKPTVKKAVFTPHVNTALYADMTEVEKAIKNPSVVIVDARSPDKYNGTSEVSDGHIPTAVNLYFEDVLTSEKDFKPATELQQLVQTKGITPEKTVIVYCMTGIKASVVYVALTQILHYKKVKLYDGAYEEWWAHYKPLVKGIK